MTEKIEINGKQYPIKVGYYALKYAVREAEAAGKKGVTMENILTDGEDVHEALLFYGIELGCKIEGIPFELKREQAEMYLDDCFTVFLQLLPTFFPTPETGKKQKTLKKSPVKK